MYAAMKRNGAPIAFQTAATATLGSLCNTLGTAITLGAGAVEIPGGYSTDPTITLSGLTAYDKALEHGVPPDTAPPSAPGTPTGTVNSPSSLTVRWPAATDTGYGVACYTVNKNGNALGTTMATTFTDTSANTKVSTPYSITAVDGAGNRTDGPSASLPVDVTAPSVPSGVTLNGNATVNSIPLKWNASSDNFGVASYTVFRDGSQVGTSTTPSFTDTGLSPNTPHSYAVSATDTSGNTSAQSSPAFSTSTAPDTTAPSVPTGLTAQATGPAGVSLSWSPSTDDVGVVAYRVYRDADTVAFYTAQGGTTTATDTVAPKSTHSYSVSAVDGAGNESAKSAPVSVTTPADTTPPGAPSGLTVTAVAANSVSLSWSAASDNVGVGSYRVMRNGAVIAKLACSGPDSCPTTYTDTTAKPKTKYKYVIKAVDTSGNVGPASNAVYATTPAS
jgi:chitodextrinase